MIQPINSLFILSAVLTILMPLEDSALKRRPKSQAEQKAFVLIVPSYNNEKWCKYNLKSILQQKYSNFRVIYINDCSKDKTLDTVIEYIKSQIPEKNINYISFNPLLLSNLADTGAYFTHKGTNHAFFTLIDNVSRCGALANQYRAIWSCDDNEIAVLVDGDDWLPNTNILSDLNQVYHKKDIWMTHGSLVEYPSNIKAWSEPIPGELIEKNAIRNFKCPTHLRTFYSWVFKKINVQDLLFESDFFPMTGDMAFMFPLTEMCGERHAFLPQTTYIYNMSNTINDNKVNAEMQNFFDSLIRNKAPYEKL